MNRERINGSGCRDPVPYEAIKNVTKASRNKRDNDADDLVQTIKSMVQLAGFELIDRIRFKDTKTGKKYL